MKYKTNDILIDRDKNKIKVLEAFTNVYILSSVLSFDVANSSVFTESEVDNLGYTLFDEWTPDDLKYCDEYWYIESTGTIFKTQNMDLSEDIFRIKNKNVYRTREDAEKNLKEILED